ncbi:MAG: response regulator transcription factor [Hyphomicrobiaceae bacterium]
MTQTTNTPSAAKPGKAGDGAPADNAAHILIVDDDTRIRELVARFLQGAGFRVTMAGDAESARAAMRGLAFDLVILDVMMPGESGLELARSLKAISPIPICMMTALADPQQRVAGLAIGVDDYVTKPFDPRELVFRLQNILGRSQAKAAPADEVRMGDIVFYASRGDLKRGEDIIRITDRERDLLRLFASRPGKPISRHELTPDDTTGSERAIDVQINRLRRKIERDPADPLFLQTVRGTGYRLVIERR